jgi:hydrogenase maturation protein HypF
LFEDIGRGNDTAIIARKVFYSLAKCIVEMSSHFHVNQVAFSGGVFQNALLVDLIYEQATAEMKLYFHRQLSPNDECIGLGQLACYETAGRQAEKDRQQKKKVLQTASYH